MNLRTKKKLIARTLNVGIDRVIIKSQEEVKEAITRQDILELVNSKLILIRPEKGRRKIEKRKSRRRAGSIKKTVSVRKEKYMLLTRKLRKSLKNLRKKMTKDKYDNLRKKIKARDFRSIAHMNEYMVGK